MTSDLRFEPCHEPARFIDAQRAFYEGDPDFVPPLTFSDRVKVDVHKHPFFEHATAEFWLATRGDDVVGRISVSRDRLHDEFHGDKVGFFGHFEATDAETARALLEHAAERLRSMGAEAIRGPIDGSTNYRCGLLVEGDPGPPFVMMPYNDRHYGGWIEAAGLQPVKDLLALHLTNETLDLARIDRLVAKIARRTPVETRPIDLGRFEDEVGLLWDLYNRIWKTNWGFAPMSEAEFRHEAKELRAVVKPELTTIVSRDGVPIAFALGVPDLSPALQACNGRLLPFGWFRAWRALRRVRRFRLITLGIVPELRGSGLDALMMRTVIAQAQAKGWNECEASWILEDNLGMLRPLLSSGARVWRRYRIYERRL